MKTAIAMTPNTMTDLLAVVPSVEYYWRRTEGWNWFGVERWWQVFVVFADGMNGGGGACIEERWRWNGSSQTMRRQPRNLTCAETVELLSDLSANSAMRINKAEQAGKGAEE